MEGSIDRIKVGRSFHQQAREYDRHVSVQKRVVNRLVSLVRSHATGHPTSILDVGCGTGQLLASLREEFPSAQLHGLDLAYNMLQCASERLTSDAHFVNADAEYLPFRDRTFDLVVSTSTLQWLENLELFFEQARRVTQNGGLLCIAFFAGRTLCELRECFRDVIGQKIDSSTNYADRLHRFMDRFEVERALERIDFDQATVISEIETDYYANVNDLLRSIKRIGAGASAQESRHKGGLGWRGVLNETSRLYSERYGRDGFIPATYEVVYIIARGRNTSSLARQ